MCHHCGRCRVIGAFWIFSPCSCSPRSSTSPPPSGFVVSSPWLRWTATRVAADLRSSNAPRPQGAMFASSQSVPADRRTAWLVGAVTWSSRRRGPGRSGDVSRITRRGAQFPRRVQPRACARLIARRPRSAVPDFTARSPSPLSVPVSGCRPPRKRPRWPDAARHGIVRLLGPPGVLAGPVTTSSKPLRHGCRCTSSSSSR